MARAPRTSSRAPGRSARRLQPPRSAPVLHPLSVTRLRRQMQLIPDPHTQRTVAELNRWKHRIVRRNDAVGRDVDEAAARRCAPRNRSTVASVPRHLGPGRQRAIASTSSLMNGASASGTPMIRRAGGFRGGLGPAQAVHAGARGLRHGEVVDQEPAAVVEGIGTARCRSASCDATMRCVPRSCSRDRARSAAHRAHEGGSRPRPAAARRTRRRRRPPGGASRVETAAGAGSL